MSNIKECRCQYCLTGERILAEEENMSEDFKIKDSGERKTFDSGMQRDSKRNPVRYDLIWQPGLKRLAIHMGNGAIKYKPNNWKQANSQEELDRFKESAFRHFMQWMDGERDEDHMSAVIFNMFGMEYTKDRMGQQIVGVVTDPASIQRHLDTMDALTDHLKTSPSEESGFKTVKGDGINISDVQGFTDRPEIKPGDITIMSKPEDKEKN